MITSPVDVPCCVDRWSAAGFKGWSIVVIWGPANDAVELEDVSRLRELLDAGADVENDSGDGWTLLRHAVDTEVDAHDQVGRALHVDVTALLLARGADPLRSHNGVSVLEEAEARGHWLAAELMRAWLDLGRPVDDHGPA